MNQRIASDISGPGIEGAARVPAVDLRSQEYRNQDVAPQFDPPADPEPVLTPPPNTNLFTAEAMEEARRQERNKLNSRVQTEREKAASLSKELEELRAFREQATAEAEAKVKSDERKARKEAEKDMTAKEILEQRERDWERQREQDRNELSVQLEQMRREREQEKAMVKLEREALELANYATTQVSKALNDKTIAPQFARFINGTSKDVIDAQIVDAMEATAEIVAEVAGQQAAQPAPRRGVGTNSGPSSIGSVTEVTEEAVDYTNLTLKDYIEKVRPSLQIDKRDNGIFG